MQDRRTGSLQTLPHFLVSPARLGVDRADEGFG